MLYIVTASAQMTPAKARLSRSKKRLKSKQKLMIRNRVTTAIKSKDKCIIILFPFITVLQCSMSSILLTQINSVIDS